MLLTIASDGLLGQPLAVFPSLRVGGVVGVDAEHVAARRQHVVVQYGVAAWGRGYGAAVQGMDDGRHLGLGRGQEQLLDAGPLCWVIVHGASRLGKLLVGIGLPKGVVGTLHLLVHQLLNVGIQAFQLCLCQRGGERAVDAQRPVQTLLDDLRFESGDLRF